MRGAAAVTIAAAIALGAGCKSPAEKLAGHTEDLTKILEDNVGSPKDGIEAMRQYMRKNLPDMAEAAATMLVELDKKESAGDRTEYIDDAFEDLEEPVKKLMKAAAAFEEKMKEDKELRKQLREMENSWGPSGEVLEELARAMEEKIDAANEDPAVEKLRGYADEMCECDSKECRDAVNQKFMSWAKAMRDVKPRGRTLEKLEREVERLMKCQAEVTK